MNQPFFVCMLYIYNMKFTIPIRIIELEQNNYHIILTSRFEDGSEGFWLIDTGASKSIFDRNLETHFKIIEGLSDELYSAGKGDEIMKSEVAVLNPFWFEKLRIEEMRVAVLDLSHINELYSKYTDIKICGLIGGDFLVKYGVTIDYQRKKLVLRK